MRRVGLPNPCVFRHARVAEHGGPKRVLITGGGTHASGRGQPLRLVDAPLYITEEPDAGKGLTFRS